ncbi:MAG: hypothetical protein HY319_17515 [Armatimonadetes bacterium]|nr:hypothetical protein [Armatimonadota bacterium]
MTLIVDMHAFEDAWDVDPEPGDLRSLIRVAELWLAGESDESLLVRSLERVQIVLGEALRDTRRDLREQSSLHPRMLEPIKDQIVCYQELLEALGEMGRALELREQNQVRCRLHELRVQRTRLVSSCDELDAVRMSLQCPRCGGPGPDRCRECGLELLLPAPPNAYRPLEAEAMLGAEYQAVYLAWEGVLDARLSLSGLLPPLERLEDHLHEVRGRAALMPPEALERCRDLIHVPSAVEEALEGVEQMRQTVSSRRVLDLLEGWEKIFRGAVALQEIGGSLAPDPDEAVPLEVEDQIALSTESW